MVVMTILSGAAEPLVARATTIRTLGARGEIWEAAIGLWASHPTTGTGPGTFVLALPLSGYFETNGFPPRHADSAPIQLLAEAGIIGLIAGLALVIMVIRGLIRSSPALALWPLLLFSFASLTDNPSDTPGIVAVAVAWVAVALPTRRVVANAPSSWLRITMFSAGLVVLATYSAFSIAHVAHETGIAHARAGRLHAAESAFEVAVAFDPAMALYRRDLGLVDLSRGEVAEATHSLQEAVRLSPTDPASHRAYAAALLDSGNPDLAYDVMESLVRWHPSQANLVFAALAAEANSVDSQGFLSRAVVLNPLLPGAPTWHTLFGDPTTVYELAEAAAGSSTYRLSYQPLWLSILSGKSGQVDERESLAASARLLKTGRAWSALLSCRLEESLADIRAAQHREGEDEVYWLTRLVVESANGESRPSTVRLAFLLNRRLTDAILAQGSESGTVLDPMGDLRMYGRNGLWDLPGLPRVPTGAEAWRAWIEEPVSTAVRTVPTSGLAQCQGRTVSH
jgi:tetratricopeptide (TPR) repeat protein